MINLMDQNLQKKENIAIHYLFNNNMHFSYFEEEILKKSNIICLVILLGIIYIALFQI